VITEMTLTEFLEVIAQCTGDVALDLVNQFQSGSLEIAGMTVEDVVAL
jgi:hypothetical protein